jgi:hypothetical protein
MVCDPVLANETKRQFPRSEGNAFASDIKRGIGKRNVFLPVLNSASMRTWHLELWQQHCDHERKARKIMYKSTLILSPSEP